MAIKTLAQIQAELVLQRAGSSGETLNASGILEFANNAAALVGGLVAGDFYRTGDALKIVH